MSELKTRVMLDQQATIEAFIKVKRDFDAVREYLEALKESINHINLQVSSVHENMTGVREKVEYVENNFTAIQKDNLESKNIVVEANTPHLLIVKVKGTGVSVFASGKLIVKDVESKEGAEKIAAELIKIIAERGA